MEHDPRNDNLAEEFRNSYQAFKHWADSHDWLLVSESQYSMSAVWATPNGNAWLVSVNPDGTVRGGYMKYKVDPKMHDWKQTVWFHRSIMDKCSGKQRFRHGEIAGEIAIECSRATELFPPFYSAHEGLAIIREEYLELEEEVFKNPSTRDTSKMREEAIQLGSMALRFVHDVCDKRGDE